MTTIGNTPKSNLLALAISLGLTACGGGNSPQPVVTPTPSPPVVVIPPVVTPPTPQPVVTIPPAPLPVVVAPPVVVIPPVGSSPSTIDFPVNPPDPSIIPCSSPTTVQPTVLWDKIPMVAMCSGVYVEPGISAFDENTLRLNVTAAFNKVTAFYGNLQVTQPDIILCKTQACRTYFLGAWAGVTIGAGNHLPGQHISQLAHRSLSPTPVLLVTVEIPWRMNRHMLNFSNEF